MPKDWDDVKPKKKAVSPNARRLPQDAHEQFVVDMMDHVLANTDSEPARHEWRVSSFPICGMLHLLKQIKDEARPKPYSMDFFTGVGTAVHETLQYHLTNSQKTGGLMVGNFECRACGEFKTEVPEGRRRPIACPVCGNTRLHYIEIDFAAHGVSGHLDGLIETPNRRIALEFKTTSGPNVEDPSKWLPYSKHFFQIETYCWLLGYLYNKLPTHYTIIYVNRDPSFQNPSGTRIPYYPFTFRVTPDMMDRRRREFGRTIKARALVTNILENPTQAGLQALADVRPCRSPEDYKNNMKPAFFGDETCPYAKSGACWKGKQFGMIKPVSDAWSLLQNPGTPMNLTVTLPMSYIDEIED